MREPQREIEPPDSKDDGGFLFLMVLEAFYQL